MTATLTIASNANAAAIDPTTERAAFFADLELLELTMVIPQAAAPKAVVNKY